LKKIVVLTLASLSLMSGLAGTAQATPGRTTNAPPPVSARVRNAELSALTSKLATLHLKRGTRPNARELKALGLKPVPKPLAARLKELANSTRAKAAGVGSTYWFTYQYYGAIWADVYYDGPQFDATSTYYVVYSNYKICDPTGGNCMATNVYTEVFNIDIDGTYYYETPTTDQYPDSAGFPIYGYGPFPG
jgi:hypothetical protein